MRCVLILTMTWGLIGTSGCAVQHLKADYKGFESAYASTSNREMLLNLARLNQHDPTYFFKLGQIATSYRLQAGLSGSGNYVTQGSSGAGVTGGGAPSFLYEMNPAFTFIPVNDDTTAQLLLKPIPAELFYALYQQGWRADQLFRLMVDRIEFRAPGSEQWQIIRNTPTGNALDYTRFLRVSALVYELQRRGFLLLRGRPEFTALGGKFKNPPTAADLMSAQAKNLVWRQVGSEWALGQETISPLFELNPKELTPADQAEILKDMPELSRGGIGGVTALSAVLDILQNGFTIQGNAAAGQLPACGGNTTPEKPEAANHCIGAHLVMRSLVGMMSAAAQEESGFDQLLKANPLVANIPFRELVPPMELHPILRLKWNPTTPVLTPLVRLSYRKQVYEVTDRTVAAAGESAGQYYSWNRDVFRLISLLTAQVTVDISKFPLPEILQLRTQ